MEEHLWNWKILIKCFLTAVLLSVHAVSFTFLLLLLLLCCTLGTVAEHVDNVINESINIVKEHDEYCHTEEMVSQDTLSNLLHTSVIYAPRVYAEI